MRKEQILDTLKQNRNLLILFFVSSAANLSVFLLYRLMTEAFYYAELIVFTFCMLLLAKDYIRSVRKREEFVAARESVEAGNLLLPEAESPEARGYQDIINILEREMEDLTVRVAGERQDLQDWYTLWVHEMKTPIAVMKLNLKEEDRQMAAELFRIEEYADMALAYIRLGAEQNDLVIREYSLDEIIRESLRKYAPQFIAKKLALNCSPTDCRVITDKKWLSCILDQLISNAVKYTGSGFVEISFRERTLTVADTGIGIAEEDLPRIFEKGYTGENGRGAEKSSGLGLYLSQRAAKLLHITLSAEGRAAGGAAFSILFPKETVVE